MTLEIGQRECDARRAPDEPPMRVEIARADGFDVKAIGVGRVTTRIDVGLIHIVARAVDGGEGAALTATRPRCRDRFGECDAIRIWRSGSRARNGRGGAGQPLAPDPRELVRHSRHGPSSFVQFAQQPSPRLRQLVMTTARRAEGPSLDPEQSCRLTVHDRLIEVGEMIERFERGRDAACFFSSRPTRNHASPRTDASRQVSG